jgi:hypothetical protein
MSGVVRQIVWRWWLLQQPTFRFIIDLSSSHNTDVKRGRGDGPKREAGSCNEGLVAISYQI